MHHFHQQLCMIQPWYTNPIHGCEYIFKFGLYLFSKGIYKHKIGIDKVKSLQLSWELEAEEHDVYLIQ